MSRSLDRIDRQIVSLLQKNGRLANVEIARDLGLAEGTVRKRLERLLEAGVIHIVAVVEPERVDYPIHTIVGIEADLAQLQQIARRIAALPEVTGVSLVTGTYDLLIEVVLTSSDQLLSFLMDRIAGIPGIKRTETCQVLKMVKRPADWTIPGEPVAEAGSGTPPVSQSVTEVIPGTIIVPERQFPGR